MKSKSTYQKKYALYVARRAYYEELFNDIQYSLQEYKKYVDHIGRKVISLPTEYNINTIEYALWTFMTDVVRVIYMSTKFQNSAEFASRIRKYYHKYQNLILERQEIIRDCSMEDIKNILEADKVSKVEFNEFRKICDEFFDEFYNVHLL